jgi:putative oxidoreductase
MTSLTADRYDNLTSSAGRRLVHSLLATNNSSLLTILRVTLGLVILPHGLQKTLGWFGGYGFTGTMGGFTSMGIPAFLAFLVIVSESAGALALITGFTTRIAAFGIGTTLAVASLMHKSNGFFMNWSGQQKGEGFEYHILAVGIAIVLMIGGAGRLSLDRAISNTTK